MTDAYPPDWLALREPYDAAARSVALAAALAAALPGRPHLLDIGAGTGSLLRWLAPLIGGDQLWTLADADAALLDYAVRGTAAWAGRQGGRAQQDGDGLVLHMKLGSWRIRTLRADLAAGLPTIGADAVVCSALLDLVSQTWIERLAASLAMPLLACLSVDGREAWQPAHPLDRALRASFRADQKRDKGFGPALGPAAPSRLQAALRRHGFSVRTAPSDWRIAPAATAMLLHTTRSLAALASSRLPGARAAVADWQQARIRQIATRRLAIRIGHRDILALPEAPSSNAGASRR